MIVLPWTRLIAATVKMKSTVSTVCLLPDSHAPPLCLDIQHGPRKAFRSKGPFGLSRLAISQQRSTQTVQDIVDLA